MQWKDDRHHKAKWSPKQRGKHVMCKNKTKQMEGDEELTEVCKAINVFGTSKL